MVENPTVSLLNSDNKLQETNDGDIAAKEGPTDYIQEKKPYFLQIALQLLDVFTKDKLQLFVLQVYSHYISL